MPIIDDHGRIPVILGGHPGDPSSWQAAQKQGAEKMEDARMYLYSSKTPGQHRRGSFPSLRCGFSYGGGQTQPMNFYNSDRKQVVIDGLNSELFFKRAAGFASSTRQLFSIHSDMLKLLYRCLPYLGSRPLRLLRYQSQPSP